MSGTGGSTLRRGASAFGSGVLFATGLGLSGMTSPRKVIGFLDFFGRWDPSLVFVMAAAVTVFAVGYRLVLRRGVVVGGGSLPVPPSDRIDARLLVGAAIFGVGWGMAGYCPGPAVVSLASGSWAPIVFVGAMVAGLRIGIAITSRRSGGQAQSTSCEGVVAPADLQGDPRLAR